MVITQTDPTNPLSLPELLNAVQAAAICGMGRSSWDRFTAMGKNPAAIRVGKSPKWSRRELQAWIDHHCPDREAWAILWPKLRTKTQTH